jgi:hypothetical protein
MSQVNTELNLSSTATISLNDAAVRTLFGVPSGAISMSNGYGKSNGIYLTIAANTTQYDIFVAAGSPTTQVNVSLTINPGVIVGSVTGGTYAMRTGTGWVAGSTISIINNGTIQGIGGNGGNGQDGDVGLPGQPGGNALHLNWPVTITNGSGFIFGGGGGGGAGGGDGDLKGTASGGGGGGGRSALTNSVGGSAVSATPGAAGTASAAGVGGPGVAGYSGAGGNGGDVGSAGAAGAASTFGNNRAGGAGGAPGKAIALNGNTVTWISGNDSTHVKGAVA